MCVSVCRSPYLDRYLQRLRPTAVSLFVKSTRTDLRRSSLHSSSTMHSMPARRWLSLSRRDSVVRRRSGCQSVPDCATRHCRRVRCRSSRRHCVRTARASSLRPPLLRWRRSTRCRGDRILAPSTTWKRTHASCSVFRCATLAALRPWCWCTVSIPDFDIASTARLLLQQQPSVLGACIDGTNC